VEHIPYVSQEMAVLHTVAMLLPYILPKKLTKVANNFKIIRLSDIRVSLVEPVSSVLLMATNYNYKSGVVSSDMTAMPSFMFTWLLQKDR